MATRDSFLDALDAPAPVKPRKPASVPFGKPVSLPPDPFKPVRPIVDRAPVAPVARPDYADDIDQLVYEMVMRGDVYLDVDANTYRTRKRSWKYGDVS